jgi:hypothetical protein
MRAAPLFFLPVCVLCLITFVPNARTAPALTDKPVKYEYAEISFTRALGMAARGKGGQATGPAGTPIRWTTAEDEIEVQEWAELAEKLKAPPSKMNNPSESVHKFRVLNKLSADGWELMEQSLSDIRTPAFMGWSFRRRLP